ncbi:MAG: HAD-IC family P-type ATPase [Planctomycetes bacterium]|nr:HAD-IC family P-type ATPase [Planctomycetota bacterium]
MKVESRARSAPRVAAPAASPAEEVARALDVDPRQGLDEAEVARRRAVVGANQLRGLEPASAWHVLARQFASWIVALLGAAALAAFAVGEWLDGAAVIVVLVLNAAIGFATELRAVRSMEALRRLGEVHARVRRGGREHEVDAVELVPGDVVLLEAGDVVTADLRLLSASKLEADESTLTGESLPVAKDPAVCAPDVPLAERSCQLFKGTALTRGACEALVTATGMQTELGRIAELVQRATQEATPLERQLAVLGRKLIVVTVALAAVTVAAGIAWGKPLLLMIETGIALAVAAIPEGLPIVATLALARGMARMARRNALVNRLAAVETLGATTVIFSDKTGTLTQNRMVVRRVELEGRELDLDGVAELDVTGDAALRAALEAAVLCNNAALHGDVRLGDPMEIALLELGAKAGLSRAALVAEWPEVREEAFDPATLCMATVHRRGDEVRVALKGAAERVLAACDDALDARGARRPLDEAARRAWSARLDALGALGLRLLGVAERRGGAVDGPLRAQGSPGSGCSRSPTRRAPTCAPRSSVPRRGRARRDGDRRPRGDGGERGGGPRARARARRARGQRPRARRPRRALAGRARRAARRRPVRARHAGAEARADRRPPGARRGRRDDRRRRQRRARAAQGRHRRRDGQGRHAGRARRRGHGADRRRVPVDRRGDRGGPRDLRQHPSVRLLPAVVQRERGARGRARGRGRRAAAAPAAADPLPEPRHRRLPGARARVRGGGRRRAAPAAARPPRGRADARALARGRRLRAAHRRRGARRAVGRARGARLRARTRRDGVLPRARLRAAHARLQRAHARPRPAGERGHAQPLRLGRARAVRAAARRGGALTAARARARDARPRRGGVGARARGRARALAGRRARPRAADLQEPSPRGS